MSVVEIPRVLREGDLPAVCIVTGATEGVRYRSTTLHFTPMPARLALAFCGIVGIVVFAVMRQQTQLPLPYTDAAWRRHQTAQRVGIALLLCAIVPMLLIFFPLRALGLPSAMLLGLAAGALILAAVAYQLLVARRTGAICQDMTADTVRLELPSDAAAAAIREKYAPAVYAVAEGAERDVRDAVSARGACVVARYAARVLETARIDDLDVVILYRPTGPQELALVRVSAMKRWPPRLDEQPIFYPVTNERYAREIAERWNVADSGAGFVTRFAVRADAVARYAVQTVGAGHHSELWIPAEELEALNDAIVGDIEVIAAFTRDSGVGP